MNLAKVGVGLPVHWTAQVSLVKTGNAHALTLGGAEARYFVRTRPSEESIYLPEGIGRFIQAAGTARIRAVTREARGIVVEGTLAPNQSRDFSPNDLVCLHLPVGGGKVDLYGHFYSEESLAAGEVRFATLPQDFPADTLRALEAAQRASLPPVPFEVVPVLSSPCDLYSLGVLATRCLLVNAHNSLPTALDEILSLAREAGSLPQDETLAQRVGCVMKNDARFAKALGPHRLLREAKEPDEAAAFLPEQLWFQLLAVLTRFFPGASPDSYCRDYGDAPSLALERVYAEPIAELEQLLLHSRSLIFIDWKTNREIHAVIQRVKKQFA